MKIIVINGSPKGKGNTYKICKTVEEKIKKMDKEIKFEYIHLKVDYMFNRF
ncbi:NAD(P)H-dependent oxidoreductase [Intestinibacter sp.]